jgi:hypothetical protein
MNDLEVLWNINIPKSPSVPKGPLDNEADKKRLAEAIAERSESSPVSAGS